MKRKHILRPLAILCAVSFLLAGCDIPSFFSPVGKDIKFSAKTSTSSITTKTVYTGETVTGGDAHTNKIERIGWEDGDLITVVSAQAESPGNSDYSLSPSTVSGKFHYADATPTAAGGHGLQWGDGEHTFYAMYPASSAFPASGSADEVTQSDVGIAINGSGFGVVSVKLPADQSFSTTRESANESGVGTHYYYGDMRLAYMTAATKGTPTGSPILLSFTPIVTTFYVTVKNTTGKTMNLLRVSLSSTRDALTGESTATLYSVNEISDDYANEPNYVNYACDFSAAPTRTSSNSTIYSDFGTGLSLGADESVVVALFALPRPRSQYISELTLSVKSDAGEVKLPLKKDNQWIQFTGCNKHNINNVAVPDVDYVLTRDKATLTYDFEGVGTTAQEFTVTSKKVFNKGTAEEYERPAGWKTQIYDDATSTWVDLEGNCPTWLKHFPLDQTGRTTADGTISDAEALYHTYMKDVEKQPVTSHVNKLKSNKVFDANGVEYDNSTKANAIDLSRYNFINHRQEPLRTTANCYIVAAPGWYKIPLVYGNLYEKGSIVANACKGRGWYSNHLDYFKKAPQDENIYLGRDYPWLRSATTTGLIIESFYDHARVFWELYTSHDGTTATTTGAKITGDVDDAPSGIITVEHYPAKEGNEVYIYFKVDEDKIKPGNFLLASFNRDDDCCWSWHIWITDQNMNPVLYGDNRVLPVNIGWIDDTGGQYYEERSRVLKFVSTEKAGLESETMTVIQPYYEKASTSGWQTYYQWGRKDPMTDISYGITQIKKDDRALNGSIKHPTQIQVDESTSGQEEYYDWTSANYNNLWDSQNNSYGSASSSLPDHKTVYDPSPRGFSVAPDHAWDNLNNYYAFKEESSRLKGVMFYTSSSKTDSLFFPSVGCLSFNAGTISGEGSGYYWTIRPGESGNRRASFSLRFNKSGSSLNYYPAQYGPVGSFEASSRAYCYGVRSVLYDVSASTSDDIENPVTQDIVFKNELGNSNINDLDGTSFTEGDVTVSFTRPLSNINHMSYNGSTGLVTLPNSGVSDGNSTSRMTVSVPSGHNIVMIILYFDSTDTGGSAISAVSSPENGGGYDDGNGSEGQNGIWNISHYSNGTFTPNANSVEFRTAVTGSDRVLSGLTVIYK